MTPSTEYARTDEHGVMRVGNTRVMIESVIYPFQRGESPESIRAQYPSLTLEQVYGTITYYLGHRDEVDAYLSRQDQEWQKARAEAEQRPTPMTKQLRSLKNMNASQQP